MKNIFSISYLSLIYLFFYIPIAVLVAYSFNQAEFSIIWQGFTLDWYGKLFQDADIWKAVLHTLFLGICASSVATLLGTIASVNFYRYRFMGRKILHIMIFILILAPDIVLGISLLIFFSSVKLPFGFTTLLIAHITFCIPFVVFTVSARLVQLDKNLLEAAKDLGASDFMIFHKILVPLLSPAMFAGFLLGFSLSIDDVIVSYFVSGPEYEILPLKIYSLVKLGVSPEVNALCALTFIVTLILVLASQLVLKRK